MKVLQIIDSLPIGGGARFVVNFVLALNKIGIKTDILLLDGTETEFFNELKESDTCKIIALTIGNRWNPKNVFEIMPYFKEYDLVHVHIFPTSYFVALAKFFSGTKTPIVFTEHNSQNRRATHFLFRFIEKFVYSQFNKVVCLTKEVKSFVKKNLGVKENKLVIIENGVYLEKIYEAIPYKKSEIGLNESDKLILMSARFEAQKDHETIIKSLKLLPEEFKLLLAGEGSLLSKYKEFAKNLQLENRILFLNNRKDIFEIMKMVDYNVLSSNFEGLSLSAIESLASGKPFIASDVSGLNFIKNKGLLFPKGDETELARLILELYYNRNLYYQIADDCLSLAKNYSIEKMLDKYVKVYLNILN